MSKTQLFYYGDSVISDIENLLKRDSPKMIFLVTGKGSFKFSGAENFFPKFLEIFLLLDFQSLRRIRKLKM